jgi:hypothetical protein
LLLPILAHSQGSIVRQNGSYYQRPDFPFLGAQIAGATPGECIVVDVNDLLVGGSCSGQAITAATITTLIQGQTGCNTAGYVWQPQSGTCVAQTGVGGSVTASSIQSALTSLTNCANAGYVYQPQTNTCVSVTSVTAASIQSALSAQTGCNTAGYVYTPQSNTCVAQSGGGGGGAITSVIAGSGLSGGGSSGSVTVSLTNNSTTVNGVACALGSNCTVTSYTSLPSPGTVLADYQLSDGSGTAPADSSGNGNTGTFPGGSANPTWTTQGLSFTGGYPATATGQYFCTTGTTNAQTVQIAYTANYPTGNNGPSYPTYYSLFLNAAISGLGFYAASQNYGYLPGMTLNGSQISSMYGTFVGTHVLTVVYGVSGGSAPYNNDQYYLDGVLLPANSGNYSGGRSTGVYCVGGANTGYSTYLYGQVYRATFWSNQLTSQQVSQSAAQTKLFTQNKGVIYGVQQQVSNPSLPQLVCTGDSLTNGEGVTPFCTSGNLSTRLTYSINNFGIGNIGANVNASLMPYRESQYLGYLAPSNVNFIWNGTNDISTKGLTAQQALNSILNECAVSHSLGFKTIVATPISRANGGTSQDPTVKDVLGPLIRQYAVPGGCDAVADFAGNPIVGADGAYSNTTYYQSDTTHLTATGQASIIAPMASHAIDQVTGSNPQNCDPTVVTASTYTSVASDGCKVFNTASNSITDTLPSAIGYTGRVIRRCNNSLSGSNTLTIAAPSDTPFNNVTGSTSVTVPNNSCKDFKAMLISVSAAGEYWEQLN